MNIVEAIPIEKGVFGKDTLSYFSASDHIIGSIVIAPLRSKEVKSVVVACYTADTSRTSLRASSFKIRRLGKTIADGYFSESFIEAVNKTSRYHAQAAGSVLHLLVARSVINEIFDEELQSPDDTNYADISTTKSPAHIHPKTSAVSGSPETLASFLTVHISEQFKKNRSVMIVVPQTDNGMFNAKKVSQGIEEHTYVFNSEISKGKLIKDWYKAKHSPHPVAIIATSAFLSLQRKDWGSIVVFDESSTNWYSIARPHIDYRVFAEFLAKEYSCESIRVSQIPSVKTYQGVLEDTIVKREPYRSRITADSTSILSDMKKEEERSKDAFRVIGRNLHNSLEIISRDGGRIFVLCARKGSYPITMCRDCRSLLKCAACGENAVLYNERTTNSPHGLSDVTSHTDSSPRDRRTNNDYLEPYYYCKRCFKQYDAKIRCGTCGGWNLIPLGISTKRVHHAIHDIFPEIQLHVLDSDEVHTKSKARKIVTSFLSERKSVLIGTNAALGFIDEKIEVSAIASIDSLFSIPEYSINTQIFSLITKLRELATDSFILQTRVLDSEIIRQSLEGNMADFMQKEISLRETLRYPPKYTAIKISIIHNIDNKAEKAANDIAFSLSQIVGQEKVNIYRGYPFRVRGGYVWNTLLRIKSDMWPDDRIVSLLKSLPPSYDVEVNPLILS